MLPAKYFAAFRRTLLSLQVTPLFNYSADEDSKVPRNIGNSLPNYAV